MEKSSVNILQNISFFIFQRKEGVFWSRFLNDEEITAFLQILVTHTFYAYQNSQDLFIQEASKICARHRKDSHPLNKHWYTIEFDSKPALISPPIVEYLPKKIPSKPTDRSVSLCVWACVNYTFAHVSVCNLTAPAGGQRSIMTGVYSSRCILGARQVQWEGYCAFIK